ncbi:S8 family peptidase [Clostridium cochlearium]|uniref:Subtilase family n=1 Tax=Clostridium cochlearium TaxID=1494 RepID=A0A2X2W6P4_CLOCO|nr:S8 family peptidase [Clostridium cochlearium]SQB33621.1 Subtilase family [Clostridium cochlearium]
MRDNTPIKFFAKREVDNNRTEGGRGKSPRWILEGEELEEKSKQLNNSLNLIEDALQKRPPEEEFIPTVIKTKINDFAKAKSHRSEVSTLFKVNSKNNVIGLVGEDELLIKIANKQDLNKVRKNIISYNENAYAISCINKIEKLEPEIVLEKNKPGNYKVKLIKYHDYEVDRLVDEGFSKKCKSLNLEVSKSIYTDDLIVYNIKNVTTDSIEILENYTALLSIEPMPRYSIDLNFFNINESPIIRMPKEGTNYVTIGVLDSGISKIRSLEPWIVGERQTFYPESLIDPSHGTFVAGVILYGDELEDKEYTGLKGCKIFDGNVFPDLNKESIYEDELINNIREIIKNHYKDVKIWNLSGGLTVEADDSEFSDFAKALDDIQDTYGVIICKSAGNCTNFMYGKPKGRIVKSADSVRSVVVGSIAHEKNLESGIDTDFPSPFTRVGRGPANIIKPDLVHYGGNAGIDSAGNFTMNGVKSFDLNGHVSENIGTSFSTPRITSILAGLQGEIAEEFDPLLLKALLIHSANYGSNVTLSPSERLNQMGFGKPKRINEILYNDPNEITLIMRDTIRKGQYIDILDFPYPDALKRNNFYTGQVVVTLVYDPILEASQGSEYCQSNINILFGSYDEKTERDTTKNNILNPIGRENSKNILLTSNYSKTAIKSSTERFGLTERMLIEYGDKFYPVKKYAVDLSEMTPANKEKHLKGDKLWFLKIEGLYRDFIEKKALAESFELSQEFCVIITIKDPLKECKVYDEVTRLLDANNFWHSNIKLHQDVDIRVNN